jgi:hypothetical protein
VRAATFSGSERRHRTRYRVRIPFTLKSSEKEIRGTTRNVSLLGISGFSDGFMDTVQPIQCTLALTEGYGPLTINGTVIRCEPLSRPVGDGSHEIGIFFKEFPDKGEDQLEEYLQKVGHDEQDAIKAGYMLLKQRQMARRRKKRLEALRKRRRVQARLRKKKQALKKKSAGKKSARKK